MLAALFETPGKAVSRRQLLDRLERQETLASLRNLETAISRLRRKVQETCGLELPVQPSYGKGYTFTGQCAVT